MLSIKTAFCRRMGISLNVHENHLPCFKKKKIEFIILIQTYYWSLQMESEFIWKIITIIIIMDDVDAMVSGLCFGNNDVGEKTACRGTPHSLVLSLLPAVKSLPPLLPSSRRPSLAILSLSDKNLVITLDLSGNKLKTNQMETRQRFM